MDAHTMSNSLLVLGILIVPFFWSDDDLPMQHRSFEAQQILPLSVADPTTSNLEAAIEKPLL
jgi:hypothetical protein